MNLLKYKKLIIILGALAILFLVLWLPKQHQVSRLKKHSSMLDKKLEFLSKHLGDPRLLNNHILNMQKETDYYRHILPNVAKLPSILSAISKEAERQKIKVISTQPGEVKGVTNGDPALLSVDGESCQKFDLKLELVANCRNLGEYLIALREQPGAFTIQELNITKSTDNELLVDVQIMLEAHVLE